MYIYYQMPWLSHFNKWNRSNNDYKYALSGGIRETDVLFFQQEEAYKREREMAKYKR